MNTFQVLLASNTNASMNMAEANDRLQSVFPLNIQFSEVLESKAVSKNRNEELDATTYLNGLCLAQTEIPLEKVQSILKKLETEMGRIKGSEGNGLVAIDLDLVVWNQEVLRPWDVAQTYYQNCLKSLNTD